MDYTKPLLSEKRFYSIPEQAFSADGTNRGLITVLSTFPYKVGMVVQIKSTTQPIQRLKIKRIVSEHEMYVGAENTSITSYADISAYKASDAAVVFYTEDKRPVIDILEIQRQVYQEEPTVALRSHSVDYLGRSYTEQNPMPVMIVNSLGDSGIVTNEQIQDAVGEILVDSPTIDLTYDDENDEISAAIVLDSIQNGHINNVSPVKVTDAQNGRYEATLETTDATPTTAMLVSCALPGTVMFEARITCFRTGGDEGLEGDGGSFKRTFRVKTPLTAQPLIRDMQSDYTSRDNKDFNVKFDIIDTDVAIQVIGALNNNLRWNIDIITNKNN